MNNKQLTTQNYQKAQRQSIN